MMAQKNQQPNILVYALKSDDDKTNILVYAVKSDDDLKRPTKPISRNYAVTSDDDPKNQ